MSQRKLTLENNSNDFDVVIVKSLREFSAVFADDIEKVEVFFSPSKFFLEVSILVFIPTFREITQIRIVF